MIKSNSANKRKARIVKWITIFFSFVLLVELFISIAFPQLTFSYGSLITFNNVLTQSSVLGLIVCLAIMRTKNKKVIIGLAVLFTIFIAFDAYMEVKPIDTTTHPTDIKILNYDDRGNKLVVRDYLNTKTNHKIRDTVLVKDYFIFRLIKEESSSTSIGKLSTE